MTSPAGYRRLLPRDDTWQAKMWTWMRRQRATWTCRELAEATGASERLGRRYVSRLAEARYLEPAGERGGENGQIPAMRWRLVRNTGPAAPILVGVAGDGGVADPNSELTGAALARLRKLSGLTAAQFAAEVLGVVDPRTVRRYESLSTVPALVAERVRKWVK